MPKLRFGVGQRNPIGFRINVEEHVVVLHRRVRPYAMPMTWPEICALIDALTA
jgi:hypothetical protein